MTDNETYRQFRNYQPPADAVLIVPSAVEFFYDNKLGLDVIGVAIHDERLGPITLLLTVPAAQQLADNLRGMVGDLDQLRAQYRRNIEAAGEDT